MDNKESLPYQRHSETSKEAAVKAIPSSRTQYLIVFDHLRACGSNGATDEEIQKALRMNPSTQRPRRVQMVEEGKVVDSGLKRRTTSGRWAVVWRCAPPAQPRLF